MILLSRKISYAMKQTKQAVYSWLLQRDMRSYWRHFGNKLGLRVLLKRASCTLFLSNQTRRIIRLARY